MVMVSEDEKFNPASATREIFTQAINRALNDMTDAQIEALVQSAVGTEMSQRQMADLNLQSALETAVSAIRSELTQKASTSDVTAAVADEAAARQAADAELHNAVGAVAALGAKNLLKITASSQTIKGVTFTVNDAYKIGASGVEPADPSCLSCSIALEGGSDQGSTVTSQSDNNAAGNNTAAQNNSNNANAANSTVSANTSSAESSKAAASSKAAESSSKAESKAESGRDSETSTETDTDSSAESTVSITATYDEAEFDSVPPIKLDEETSTADSRGSFPKGAVAGIAVCLVIAAAGIITIVVKKKG